MWGLYIVSSYCNQSQNSGPTEALLKSSTEEMYPIAMTFLQLMNLKKNPIICSFQFWFSLAKDLVSSLKTSKQLM